MAVVPVAVRLPFRDVNPPAEKYVPVALKLPGIMLNPPTVNLPVATTLPLLVVKPYAVILPAVRLPTEVSPAMLSVAPAMLVLDTRLCTCTCCAAVIWPVRLMLPVTPMPPITTTAPVVWLVLSVPLTNPTSVPYCAFATVMLAIAALV